ncbi:hypothetical protein ACFXPN_05310 [Streptomyces griseorubiginosus]|uniref:hypothetical protein n=1 Tax=Streptomyces griseorubiginosus TaxID=67304 RepID=UPI0036A7FBA6
MTGEDGTADRNGHGMSDERREGAAPGAEQPYDDRILSDLPEPSYDRGRLEAVLGAAILAEKTDGEAERRALEAFRVARDAGAHRARTRRRDDWRPRARRRGARSWKATLSVLLASLTLGGVAYAAIGAGGGDGGSAKGAADDGGARPSVTTSAPVRSPSDSRPSESAPADRPATAKDTLAHCRAYEKLQGRGKALDSTAFQRLVAAAGGEADVSAYCTTLTDPATATAKPGKTPAPTEATEAKPGKAKPEEAAAGQGTAGPNTDKNQSRKH